MKLTLLLIFLIGMTSFIKITHAVETSRRKTKKSTITEQNKDKKTDEKIVCSTKDFEEDINALEELVKEDESKTLDDATSKLKKTTSTESKSLGLKTKKSKDDAQWDDSPRDKYLEKKAKPSDEELDKAWGKLEEKKEDKNSLLGDIWYSDAEKRWKEKELARKSKESKIKDDEEQKNEDILSEITTSLSKKKKITTKITEFVKNFLIGFANGIPAVQSCKDAIIEIIIIILRIMDVDEKFFVELEKLTLKYQKKLELAREKFLDIEKKAKKANKCYKRGDTLWKILDPVFELWKKLTEMVNKFEDVISESFAPIYEPAKNLAICVYNVSKSIKIAISFTTFGLASLPDMIYAGIAGAAAIKEIYDFFDIVSKQAVDYQKLGRQVAIVVRSILALVGLSKRRLQYKLK